MKGSAVHIAAAGPADHERRWRAPAVVRLGRHVNDLVKGAADEVHELKLGDWPHAGKRLAEGRANNCRLGNGRVNHTVGAEAVNEAVGDFERATVNANVFANTEDRR